MSEMMDALRQPARPAIAKRNDGRETRSRGACFRRAAVLRSVAAIVAFHALLMVPAMAVAKPKESPPNILFIIMDDVGIDQMRMFGYGGDGGDLDGRVPETPNIETIAREGVGFRNAWAMPACSTSRAVFFTGRYPLRTHVLGALGENDLANSMVSPYEVTLPRLLDPAGYQSAMFGKFHLALQGNSPFGDAMPSALGWDYFYGWLDPTGDPSSIDTTAGLGDPQVGGSYSCGFVPGPDPVTGEGGADSGACYTATGDCQDLVTSNGVPPGRTCRDSGGILDPGMGCSSKMPDNIDSGFANLSGHYVSPLVIIDEQGKPQTIDSTDIRARTYRGSAVVDGAIDWINAQKKKNGKQKKAQPWMASVSFSLAHTPAMQPPEALLKREPGSTTPTPEEVSRLTCATVGEDQDAVNLAQRELTTEMIEALDTELARLLVSIGLATQDEDGTLYYDAAGNKDTMIVILGDNGTLATAVKTPFDPERAKGTAYQTGVWVPLVIAGPLVEGEGRTVRSMVNVADLYYLFGEIAGVDVEASVPRHLDGKPMLAYLMDPEKDQHPIREHNFTQVGTNVQANFAINQPCQIGSACTQIPVSKSVCEDNGGVWWGDDSDVVAEPLNLCCEVNQYIYDQNVAANCDPDVDGDCQDYLKQQPLQSLAVRNATFKIVRNGFIGDENPNPYDPDVRPDCDVHDPADPNTRLPDEFYLLSEGDDQGNDTVIDYEELNLIDENGNPTRNPEVYRELVAIMDGILNSEVPCGTQGDPNLWTFDGNLDGVIDGKDLVLLRSLATPGKPFSSWYDVNVDGWTLVEAETEGDSEVIVYGSDFELIQSQLGTRCAPE